MPKVQIFIPISRDQHLDRLFLSLEQLECDPETTSLLAYVDGDRALYERVSQRVEASKFKERVSHRRKFEKPTNGLHVRRKRIAAIKNESKALIGDCDFVFGIEDDTIVPPHALSQLLQDYVAYPHAGFIEGVELGRWGLTYVGAWKADDPYEPTRMESLMPVVEKSGGNLEGISLMPDGTVELDVANVNKSVRGSIEEIDAGGFYCYLTRREHYMNHEYKPFGRNDLGPDVNFGLWLRQQGYRNYIDWGVNCVHRLKGGDSVSLPRTTARQVAVVKNGEVWEQRL